MDGQGGGGREPQRAKGGLVRRAAGRDIALAAQALALLITVRLMLWLLPFATTRHLVLAWCRPGRGCSETAERLAWALAAAARRLPSPFRACLPQALAAEALLRRHNVPAELIIGVRRCPAYPPPSSSIVFHRPSFEAHAWVESGERVVVGWVDDLPSYVRLATTTP
jgi:hypothetical protein